MKEKGECNNKNENPMPRRKFIKSLGLLGVACTSLSYTPEVSAEEPGKTTSKAADNDFNGYFPWVGP